MFTPDQTAQLQAKLAANVVRRNPRGFDYVEGWHAIAEANRIFGFDGWDRRLEELRQLGEPFEDAKGLWRVSYRARVRIIVNAADTVSQCLLTRDGCGFGSGIDRDIGRSHESAIKEAETDAMKRALMTFGNPFGLALYDKERANVAPVEPLPSSYRAKANGMGPRAAELAHEIASLESIAACTTWANARAEEIRKMPDAWQNHLRDALQAQRELVREPEDEAVPSFENA